MVAQLPSLHTAVDSTTYVRPPIARHDPSPPRPTTSPPAEGARVAGSKHVPFSGRNLIRAGSGTFVGAGKDGADDVVDGRGGGGSSERPGAPSHQNTKLL